MQSFQTFIHAGPVPADTLAVDDMDSAIVQGGHVRKSHKIGAICFRKAVWFVGQEDDLGHQSGHFIERYSRIATIAPSHARVQQFRVLSKVRRQGESPLPLGEDISAAANR